jgi:DNA-binding CsgD family transcriptional regulator
VPGVSTYSPVQICATTSKSLACGTPTMGVKELPLTTREREIMHWVAIGKTNYEIGMILSISTNTAKNHLRHIFKKLNVANRAQAVSKLKTEYQGRK